MKKNYTKAFLFVLLILNSIACLGQLPDFTLTVTATNETCEFNGVLNFTVSGTNPNTNVTYSIYRLPSTTPFITLATNSLSGLNAGNYRVVATQSLGSENNSKEATVTILNLITPLDYYISGSSILANCGNFGVIQANIISGNPVSYEIISGPVTRPLQPSGTFTNLPAGSYLVRAFDNCQVGVVRSYILTLPNYAAGGISILGPEFEEPELLSCDSVESGFRINIAPQYYVAFPLTFTFTIFPPGGGVPIIVTHVVNGIPTSFANGGVLPSYDSPPYFTDLPYFDSPYTYNIVVMDACGNEYSRNGATFNNPMTASITEEIGLCGEKFFKLGAQFHKFPLTVEFLDSPIGFDPIAFNSGHDTFNDFPQYGNINNPVPEGFYQVRITDACGKTALAEIEISNTLDPYAEGSLSNCEIGPEIVAGVGGNMIVSIFITEAPDDFAYEVRYDASFFIIGGVATITGILVPGDYVLEMLDDCGNTHTIAVTINVTNPPDLPVNYLGGCGPGLGSVFIGSGQITLQTVIFEDGPEDYAPGFPHTVSNNINGRFFYMNSLPVGTYIVYTKDVCNIERRLTVNITEYIAAASVDITERCSSFDLKLTYVSQNAGSNLGFWLQKYNENTGGWGHPITNVAYNPNTIPNPANALSISNNVFNNNINAISGRYRILTITRIYPNGANGAGLINCYHTAIEFNVGIPPSIDDIITSSCAANDFDVLLQATGNAPFIYRILEKNGEPFVVNNQGNPMFSNLETGVYTFEIEDACGNRTNSTYEVTAPFSFTLVPELCPGQNSNLSVPEFSYLEYEWFKEGAENTILSTSATLNFNPLAFPADAGIYYVSIIYPLDSNSCLNQLLSYEIEATILPNAGEDNQVSFCSAQSINLFNYLIGNNEENGIWEQLTPGGALNSNIWDPSGIQSGSFDFKFTVNGLCGFTDEAIITIIIAEPLATPSIQAVSPVCSGESINLVIDNPSSGISYSWTGPNDFTSTLQNPTIANATTAMSGNYTVTATLGECSSQSTTINVAVKALPDFGFTQESIAICLGQSANITLVPANFNMADATVSWYWGTTLAGENITDLEVDQTGIYEVVVDWNGCVLRKTIEITENSNVFAVGTRARCENERYMLSAFAIDNSFNEQNASYAWTGPDNFYATTQFVEISGLESGIYAVVVTDESGCSVTESIAVEKGFCKIPKGISPNNDGNNDFWDLTGLDISKVKIFNRYGVQVYELDNYVNQWDGRSFNGNLLPTATYYYYIRFRSGEEKTGWVYLNRQIQ